MAMVTSMMNNVPKITFAKLYPLTLIAILCGSAPLFEIKISVAFRRILYAIIMLYIDYIIIVISETSVRLIWLVYIWLYQYFIIGLESIFYIICQIIQYRDVFVISIIFLTVSFLFRSKRWSEVLLE